MTMGTYYFMVKFDSIEDRNKVIKGEPRWLMVVIQRLNTGHPFNPCEESFGHALRWI